MICKRPANTTRDLGAPPNWDQSKSPCRHLAIQDVVSTNGPAMISLWEPTPEELDRLNQGAPVSLMVMGTMHPPVAINVGMVPGEPPE